MAHPALGVEKAENQKFGAYLLGYILDPEHPQASSADLLESLVYRISQGMDPFAAIEPLGGRWILVN